MKFVQRSSIIMVTIALALTLTACGKKGELEPPSPSTNASETR